MKYRGLTYNREKESYEWVYGLPSYGYATDEVAEIGTVYGDFREIFPDTLGEQTPYRDKNGKEIYTGDIVALEVDGQIREFVVDKATVDREYNTLPSFEGDTVKVRLADVVIFRWADPEGVIHQLLPCVNEAGVGALCGVCICIQDDFFFIPWNVWRDMKEMYGRQYLKPDDIEEYKVKFDGAVHFLMHTEELKGAYENAERKR